MDDYQFIDSEIAKRYKAKTGYSKKSIGDFFINDDPSKPVNVKSNNVDKNNYSPNIISAKKLIKWVHEEGNELFFVFVDYKKTAKGIEIINDTGIIPIHHISWDCLTIESQGWGVIQMSGKLVVDKSQDLKGFFRGMKTAYEKYMDKETKKMAKIREMIKDF